MSLSTKTKRPYLNTYIPNIGKMVTVEYLDIDELEAKCWLTEYSMIGYTDNSDLRLKLSDIGKKDNLFVSHIYEEGRIELTKYITF